jgi:hypothetical protein
MLRLLTLSSKAKIYLEVVLARPEVACIVEIWSLF